MTPPEEEHGVVTAEIHVTPYIFRELMRSTKEHDSTRVMRQILSRHWTYRPSIDPDDIIEVVDWEKSEARREGFVVKAIVRVARGRHRVSEFILSHDVHGIEVMRWVTGYGEVKGVLVECTECGDNLRLSRESLEGNTDGD